MSKLYTPAPIGDLRVAVCRCTPPCVVLTFVGVLLFVCRVHTDVKMSLGGVYSSYTQGKGDMDSRTFVKLCKETGIIDKGTTTTDIDLIFTKCKAKVRNCFAYPRFFSLLSPHVNILGLPDIYFVLHSRVCLPCISDLSLSVGLIQLLQACVYLFEEMCAGEFGSGLYRLCIDFPGQVWSFSLLS